MAGEDSLIMTSHGKTVFSTYLYCGLHFQGLADTEETLVSGFDIILETNDIRWG